MLTADFSVSFVARFALDLEPLTSSCISPPVSAWGAGLLAPLTPHARPVVQPLLSEERLLGFVPQVRTWSILT